MHPGNIAPHILLLIYRMRTPCPVHLNGYGDLEHASLTESAINLNRSTHLVYQFLHNRHTKSDTIIVSPCVLMFLRKRLKNMPLEVIPNTNSGIFDHKLVSCNSSLAGCLLCLYEYGTMGTIVFDSIIENVHQYLL